MVLTSDRVFRSKPYLQASVAAGIALLLGCSNSSQDDTNTGANDPTGNDDSPGGSSTGGSETGNDDADEGNDPSGPDDDSASADETNDGGSDETETEGNEIVPESWQTIHLLTVRSAAYVDAVDLDGDGALEILLSTLMEEGSPAPIGMPPTGALRLLTRDGDALADWSDRVLVPIETGLGFINEPQVLDVNGDDALDIVLNTGFLNFSLGSHQFIAGPDLAEPTPFVSQSQPGSSWFWHQTAQADLDGDEDLDIVTTRTDYENGTTWSVAIDWYRHDGQGGYEAYEIDTGHCGVSLRLHDVDGDSDSDIVCSQFFGPPAEPTLVWLEQVEAPSEANAWLGEWTPHTIDDTTGLGFDIHFVDMDGDGVEELLFANHNNQNNPPVASIPSGIYAFELPEDPTTPWEKIVLDEGYTVTAPDMGNPASQGAPGHIDHGDLDGNGLVDVVATGDGADGLFVIWQHAPGQFTRRTIADGPMFGQPSIADLDGDGTLEVVATQHMYPEGFVLPEGNLRIYKPFL